MADRTPIEWADATWNPITGCSRVSEGCRNCYAEIMAARFSKPAQWGAGLAQIVRKPDGSADHRWTGQVRFNERALTQPLRWRKPRRIFVCSTSDLFHEGVPDEWLDRVFAVMAQARQHTFMVLTKRPQRAREYVAPRLFESPSMQDRLWSIYHASRSKHVPAWPLPNVWVGTSIEDQATADARIPHLLATPAAVRFVSAEPLLGPVDLTGYLPDLDCGDGLDLAIVGGESGPGARPMHPDWPRALRDQCVAAGVAFFFKQWGEWGAGSVSMTTGEPVFRAFPNFQTWVNKASTWALGAACLDAAGRRCVRGADFMRARDEGTFPVTIVHRLGKKRTGRLLDGKVWDQMPGGGDGCLR